MMFRNISLGTYYPGNSLLHRLQARTKLLLLIWLAIFLIIANNHFWHFALYVVLFLLPLPSLHRLLRHRLLRRVRVLLIFLTMVALVTLWFTRNIPLSNTFPVGPFVITDLGVWLLVSFSTVFVVLYTFSLL